MTLSFAKTARACIDAKAKPPGSLGVLEHWAVRCGHANSEAQRHLLDIAGQHVVQWPLCNLAVCVVLSYIIVILLNNYTVTLHGYDVLRPCVGVYVPARLAALQHTVRPQIQGARLLVFAADHGITKTIPDVSAYPRSVTPAMFAAIAQGQAASNALAAANDCGVILTDVGVDADVSHICSKTATVLHRKVTSGSKPMTEGPAMTASECQLAMAVGAEAVVLASKEMEQAARLPGWCSSQGVLCIGELGIGNTTAAAALLAALCPDLTPEDVCGRGTGVDDAGLLVKQTVVQEALATNQALIQQGPLQALQGVGGLELAAMAGAYLEAAQQGIPALVDGYISGVAALAACRHSPDKVRQCLFVSHQSAEAYQRGGARLLQELGCGAPVLQLGFRLGEGTGAVLALPLLRSAAAVIRDMASLDEVLAAHGAP